MNFHWIFLEHTTFIWMKKKYKLSMVNSVQKMKINIFIPCISSCWSQTVHVHVNEVHEYWNNIVHCEQRCMQLFCKVFSWWKDLMFQTMIFDIISPLCYIPLYCDVQVNYLNFCKKKNRNSFNDMPVTYFSRWMKSPNESGKVT